MCPVALYFDENKYEGEYETSILKYLEGAIESWDFENEIESSPEDLYELIKQFCASLMTASTNLSETESLYELFTRTKRQVRACDDYDGPDFNEIIEMQLAKEAISMIASGASNLWDIFVALCCIRDIEINNISMHYLQRVLRCYIWGMYPEATILCRSVIETAIDDTVSDSSCEAIFGERKSPYPGFKGSLYTLNEKIIVLKKDGGVPGEIVDHFDTIKWRGNKSVHCGLVLNKEEVKKTIIHTAKVLVILSNLNN